MNYSIMTKRERNIYIFQLTMLRHKCRVYFEMRELEWEVHNREENYN